MGFKIQDLNNISGYKNEKYLNNDILDLFKIIHLLNTIKPEAAKNLISEMKLTKLIILDKNEVEFTDSLIENNQKLSESLMLCLKSIKNEVSYVNSPNDKSFYFNFSSFFKSNLNLSQAIDFYNGLSEIMKEREPNIFNLVEAQSHYNLSHYVNNHDLLRKMLSSPYFSEKLNSPFNQKSYEKFLNIIFSSFKVKNSISDYKEIKNVVYEFFKSKNPTVQDTSSVEDILINNVELPDKYEALMDFLDEGNKEASVYQIKLFKRLVFSSLTNQRLQENLKYLRDKTFSKSQQLDVFFDIFSEEDFFKNQSKINLSNLNSSMYAYVRNNTAEMKKTLLHVSQLEGFDSELNTPRGNKAFFLMMDYLSYNLNTSINFSVESFGDNEFKVGSLTFKNMTQAMLSLQSMPMDMIAYINEKSKDKKEEIYKLILDRFTNGKYHQETIINPFNKEEDLILSFITELKKNYSDKDIFTSFIVDYKHPYNKEALKDKRRLELRTVDKIEFKPNDYELEVQRNTEYHLFNTFIQKFMGENPNMVWDLKKEAHPLVSFLENNSHLISNGVVKTDDLGHFFEVERIFLKYTNIKFNDFNYLSTDINHQTITLDSHLKQLMDKTHHTFAVINGFRGYPSRVWDYQKLERDEVRSITFKLKNFFNKDSTNKKTPIDKMGYINGLYKEGADIDLLSSNKSKVNDNSIHGKTMETYNELMKILNNNQDLGLSIEVQMKAEKLMIDNLSFIKQIKNLEDVLPMEVKHFYENSFNKYLVQSVSIYVNGMKKYNTMNSIINDKEKNIFSRMSNRDLSVNPESFKEKIETEAIRQLDLLEKELNHIEGNILTQLTNDTIKESNIQTRVLQERKETLREVNVLEMNGSNPIKILNKKV